MLQIRPEDTTSRWALVRTMLNRGDVNEAATVSCGREDLLRREGDRWKIARRTIFIDESVIRMQNLAIFL